uniref:CSON005935 protein n=1 Tax=Culicoides sonorensis TaxID=179676 RepID=A0A336L704_CULSO
MPRTKISKNRKRSNCVIRIDEKLQELDIIVDQYFEDIQSKYECAMSDIEQQMHKVRSQIPARILKMKISDLHKMGINNFSDVKNSPMPHENATGSAYRNLHSTRESFSPILAPMLRKQSTFDDGYSTHEDNRNSQSSSNGNTRLPIPKITGPFMSAQMKKRRSRSAQSSVADNVYTPQLNQFNGPLQSRNSHMMKRTGPMSGMLSNRVSRPRFRTPVMHGRLKAASADRLMITPKVQPNTPMALLRHARTGESVFSVTGSPVITSVSGTHEANVNIPVGDSILSIRPTEMGEICPSYISKIDKSTIQHLKVLQQNLNRIMQSALGSDH